MNDYSAQNYICQLLDAIHFYGAKATGYLMADPGWMYPDGKMPPMAALIALTLLAFWAVAALLLAGLCFGWRYRFAGPDLGKPRVNEVMDSIDGAAADARRYVRGKWDEYKKK